MRAMRKWPWSRDVRARAPADPPEPDRPSSGTAPEPAGPGRPPAGPILTGRRRRPLRRAQRASGAPVGDPTDEARRLWLRRLDDWAREDGEPGPPADRVVDRFADRDRISVAVLGDPGGRAAQYAVAPVLLRAAGDTDLAVACSDIGAPAGGLRSYEERLLAPYADYPAPIYGVPGNDDWYDGLAGFMTVFCGAPPGARAPTPDRRRAGLAPARAPPVLAAAADGHAGAARRRPLVPRHRRPVHRPAGPYCAIDAGPLRLVLIDTGLSGRVDAEQARWLRTVSATGGPKILLRRPAGVRGGPAAPHPDRRGRC